MAVTLEQLQGEVQLLTQQNQALHAQLQQLRDVQANLTPQLLDRLARLPDALDRQRQQIIDTRSLGKPP
eukprot:4739553-Prorocentrum_lima.AAC.1